MNVQKLRLAEQLFLSRYPGGFAHPELQEIVKRHHPTKMRAMAQENFQPGNFDNPGAVCQAMVQIITRSSLVSVFEKPKFRDQVKSLSDAHQEALAEALYHQLHGPEADGFSALVAALDRVKLAKWPLVTVIPAYFRPQEQVFVKPTTAKGILAYFEVEGLSYQSHPTYEFYRQFRELILDMRRRVSPDLAPDNAAFSGFLMMSFREPEET